MSRRIKVIWDFKGDDAQQTAQHHAIHLKEFSEREQITNYSCGVDSINILHYTAYLTVNEQDVYTVRDALRPHRAEIV